MLQINKYRKAYGNKEVLKIEEMKLPHNIYWLKGQNGGGKSTLLKSIAGYIPFEGEIFINGISIKKSPINYRLQVNFSEAEAVYPPFVTGKDLVSFYIKTKGGTHQQADYLLKELNVAHYYEDKIETYSSGMVKKLSLLLSFIGNPKLILLDEPLITLDHSAVEAIYKMIGERFKAGVSFILTSHQDLNSFAELNPTVIQISDKTLLREGYVEHTV
jgi:ABC-2 type transport system ATP-binding protein